MAYEYPIVVNRLSVMVKSPKPLTDDELEAVLDRLVGDEEMDSGQIEDTLERRYDLPEAIAYTVPDGMEWEVVK